MKKNNPVILIVDDSDIIYDRLSEILKESIQTKSIKRAINFEEGLLQLELVKPDIVLLDISLPDKNGIELLKIIKARYPDMKVIVITNHANEYYRNLCTSLGALHFFDKSNDYDLIPQYVSGINFAN